jgi:hypothetical protein
MADRFLKGCVKDVEDLARERREFQVRLMEPTQLLADQSASKQLEQDVEQDSTIQQWKQDTATRTERKSDEEITRSAPKNEDELHTMERVQQLESVLKRILDWATKEGKWTRCYR